MSGQAQPGTALQALAEKLRTDAIAIFGEGLAERDIIEWFYGALLAAAPATPAGQGAVPDVSAMAKVLSDRAASACCVDPDDNWKIYGQEYIEDVRAMLSAAQPSQAVRALVSAADVRDACANAVSVFDEETNADQCREVAEYMREVLLALIARRTALAASTGQEVGK